MHGLEPVQCVVGVGDLVAARIGDGSYPASGVPLVDGRAQGINHGLQPIVLGIGKMDIGAILITDRVHLTGGGAGIGGHISVAVGAGVDGGIIIIGITGDPAKGVSFLGDQAPVVVP